MSLRLSSELLSEIHAHGEASYPEEGAGLLLGTLAGDLRVVKSTMTFENAREEPARRNRYLLTPQDYLRGEGEAARLGLDVIGVFHSHPDHPNRPSEFDRQWAMPNLSYLITSVHAGEASGSRSWLLRQDRSNFDEETINVVNGAHP